MKRLFFLTLFINLLFISIPNLIAKEITTYDDTNQYFFTTTENIQKDMYGITWNKITGKTKTSDQHINLFSMKADGETSKLVVWSPQYQNFRNSRTTLSKLAANYEKKHPGWKVVAGINADQYIMNFGTETIKSGQDYYEWQPYYPMIIDGERRFPYSMTATSSNAIAFTNNGTKNGFIDVNNIDGLYLEILDENDNILSKHLVDGINLPSSDNNTTVWFSYVNKYQKYEEVKVESSDNLFIVSNAEFAYMSNSRTYTYKDKYAVDSVFGRGTIDKIDTSFTLNKGQFIIDTKDSNLLSKLGTDVRVRVQFYYNNEELNNIEAASGYHCIQRLNGVDMKVSGSYNTSTYSRSVFGIKEDGTYILMTADMTSNKSIAGLNGWEINAFLKQNDVVTAYQDDGGGSVTAVFRNENGGFDVVNTPRDGGERSILSGLFFVVKDSGISISSVDATNNSLTFNIDTSNADMDKITQIYCTVNNTTKEVINNTVTFDGLEKMTEYSYSFSYDTDTDKNKDAIVSGTYKTAKTKPTILDLKTEIKDNLVLFTPIFEDVDEAFEYIRIVVNDIRYPYLGEPIEVPITSDLKKLDYLLTFSYDLKDGKDKVVIEENKILILIEDDPINPEPNDPVLPDVPCVPEVPEGDKPVEEKGCKKETLFIISSLISLSTILVLFRKRK